MMSRFALSLSPSDSENLVRQGTSLRNYFREERNNDIDVDFAEAIEDIISGNTILDTEELRISLDISMDFAANYIRFNPPTTMNSSEIAAFHFYTYQVSVGEQPYALLNRILRARGAQRLTELAPFKKYVWLLLKACSKLPSYEGHTVYRAITVDISASCRVGEQFTANDFLSTSTKLEKCQEFLRGCATKGSLLIYELQNETLARNIRKYSQFEDEEEVLIPSGSRLEVAGAPVDAGDFVIIQIREKPALERDVILSMNPAQVHLQQVQEGAAATHSVDPTVFEDMQARLLEVERERENARLREEVRQREMAELTERLRLAELVYICVITFSQ